MSPIERQTFHLMLANPAIENMRRKKQEVNWNLSNLLAFSKIFKNPFLEKSIEQVKLSLERHQGIISKAYDKTLVVGNWMTRKDGPDIWKNMCGFHCKLTCILRHKYPNQLNFHFVE